MKKLISLLLCSMLVLTSFCSCTDSKEVNEETTISEESTTVIDGPDDGMVNGNQFANPWVEFSSVDEANKFAGTSVKIPSGMTPVSILAVENEYLDLNFEGYSIRVSATSKDDDISGDYNEYTNVSESVISEITISQYSYSNDTLNKALWVSDGVKYAFYSETDMNRMDAMNIIEAFIIDNTMLF